MSSSSDEHRLALVEGVLSALGSGPLALKAARDLVGHDAASERTCRRLLREEVAALTAAPAPAPAAQEQPRPSQPASAAAPETTASEPAPDGKGVSSAPESAKPEPGAHQPGTAGKGWVKKGEGAGGAPSDRVRAMQARLNEVIPEHPPLLDDGDFGPKTEAALKQFQRKHGLPQTGALDGRTLEAIRVPPPLPALEVNRQIAREMQAGGAEVGFTDRGPAVGQLQDKLMKLGYDAADAGEHGEPVFGRRTQAAVRRLQRENGMVPTGNADVQTMAVLERHSIAAAQPKPKAAKEPQPKAPKRAPRGKSKVLEATVVGNALVGNSVTGTRTAWGGANPAYSAPAHVASALAQKAALILGAPDEALPDVLGKLRGPPNVEEAVVFDGETLEEGFRKAFLERLHPRGRAGQFKEVFRAIDSSTEAGNRPGRAYHDRIPEKDKAAFKAAENAGAIERTVDSDDVPYYRRTPKRVMQAPTPKRPGPDVRGKPDEGEGGAQAFTEKDREEANRKGDELYDEARKAMGLGPDPRRHLRDREDGGGAKNQPADLGAQGDAHIKALKGMSPDDQQKYLADLPEAHRRWLLDTSRMGSWIDTGKPRGGAKNQPSGERVPAARPGSGKVPDVGGLKYDYVGPGAPGASGTHRVFGTDSGGNRINRGFKTQDEARRFMHEEGEAEPSRRREQEAERRHEEGGEGSTKSKELLKTAKPSTPRKEGESDEAYRARVRHEYGGEGSPESKALLSTAKPSKPGGYTGGARNQPTGKPEQTRVQSEAMRKQIRSLGVPMREETLPDGSRRLHWRIGTRTITKTIKPTGLVEGTHLEEVSSGSLPDLPNKPGKSNWVEKAGGLPSYIKRIAKHLHHEKGMEVGHAIAVAVNVVKKMCAAGDTNFPGKQNVNAGSRAQACAAVASWEAKKGKSKVSEGLDDPEFANALALFEAAFKPIPPSWNYVEKIAGEVQASYHDWGSWEDGEPPTVDLAEGALSSAARDALPAGSFVFPKERRYPIHDRSHARNALARVSQHGTAAEKAKVRAAVRARYPGLGVSEAASLEWANQLTEADLAAEPYYRVAGGVPTLYVARQPVAEFASLAEARIAEAAAKRFSTRMKGTGSKEVARKSVERLGADFDEGVSELGKADRQVAAMTAKRFKGRGGKPSTLQADASASPKTGPGRGERLPSKGGAPPDKLPRGPVRSKLREALDDLLPRGAHAGNGAADVGLVEASAVRFLERLHRRGRTGKFVDMPDLPRTGARQHEHGFEGVGDFGGSAAEQHAAHMAAKGGSSAGPRGKPRRVEPDPETGRLVYADLDPEDKEFVGQLEGAGARNQPAGKKPYPGLGKFVVVQDIGGGRAAVIDGANTEEAAKAKAKKYPGTVSVHPNEPGSPAAPGTITGAGSPGAAGGGDDDLAIDMAIGGVLASYPGLTDWSLDKKDDGWELTVVMGKSKHKIRVSADGTVEEITDPKGTTAAKVKLPSGTSSPPAASEDYYLTGDEEKPFHMENGQVFKGKDGLYYRKIANTKKQGKNGQLAAVEIENISTGVKKVTPAFALGYYELAMPGDGRPHQPAPAAPTGDDLFGQLKASVGGKSGIAALAKKVPAGGYAATQGENGLEVTDALDALADYSIDDYRTLPKATLKRVYQTAEDANWHTVAGLAYTAWQEKEGGAVAPPAAPAPAQPSATSGSGTGRGPTGKLRNFKAMGDQKFKDAYFAIADYEKDDPEAMAAVQAEWIRRYGKHGPVAGLAEGDVNRARASNARLALEGATGMERVRLEARLRVLESRLATL